MKRIDVVFNGQEHTFRTNNSGEYLFVGVAQNSQISCESGFDSLSRMKRAIREHLRYRWETLNYDNKPMPRIKYSPPPYTDWKA